MKDSIINDFRPETRSLLKRLTEAGCTLIGCNNGEDICYASEAVANPAKPNVKRCKDEADFVEELTATDEARLTVKTPDDKRLQLFLVYGNDPGELVSDYHVNQVLDEVTEAHSAEWSDKPQPKTTNGERYPHNLRTGGQVNEFKELLRKLIAERIKQEKKDGTTAMSRDNLWQCIKVPNNAPGAPRGTNAAYYAKQAFNEVIDAEPKFKKFTTL